MAILFYLISVMASPFIGVIIAYLAFNTHKEIGLIMTMGAFISMAFVGIVYPLCWLFVS